MKHPKKQPDKANPQVLSALTASAMALPGLAGTAFADGPVEEITLDFADYSYYKEDKLRPKKTNFGSERDRMEIHSYKFRLSTPLADRADLDMAGGYETMSGASPFFILPDLAGDRGGRPAQVMSQATIDDQRVDLQLAGNYYFDAGKGSLSSGFSVENDYWSVNLGVSGEKSFNDKNTTLSLGTSVSLDYINPTDARQNNRVRSEDKQSYTVYGAISQVLTRHSTVQSTVTYTRTEGYLSDPYKGAYIDTPGGAFERDTRPEQRDQVTWLNRYRHHISKFDGTFHADYRFYIDSWKMNSHTFDLAYYQSLPFGFQLVPSFRYYSQSSADFYEVFYNDFTSNGLYSSDYRLSPYGAYSYRLKAIFTAEDVFSHWDFQAALSWERYESSAGLAFQSVGVENPGLVSFNVWAVRFTVKF